MPSANARAHISLIVIQTLLAIANAVASSFAMVFLIKSGFSQGECAFFIVIMATTAAILVLTSIDLIKRWPRYTMMLGLGMQVIYYLSFVLLHGWTMFIVAALFLGIYIPLFWVPCNIMIMQVAPKKGRGAVIGGYFLIFPAVSALGPIIGGSIIQSLGYGILFAIATAFLATAIIFLGLIKIDKTKNDAKWWLIKRREKLNLNEMPEWLRHALFFEGIQDGIFWLYPAIIGLELAKTELSLGSMLSLFALAGAAMTVVMGFASDRIHNRRVFLFAGCIITAFCCAILSITSGIKQFIILMSLISFFLAAVPAFLFTMTADEMERNWENASLIREILLNTGRVIGALVCIFLFIIYGGIGLSIVIAAIALIMIAIVARWKKTEYQNQ